MNAQGLHPSSTPTIHPMSKQLQAKVSLPVRNKQPCIKLELSYEQILPCIQGMQPKDHTTQCQSITPICAKLSIPPLHSFLHIIPFSFHDLIHPRSQLKPRIYLSKIPKDSQEEETYQPHQT